MPTLLNLLNNPSSTSFSNLSISQSTKLTKELLEILSSSKSEIFEDICLNSLKNIFSLHPDLFSFIDRNSIDKLESLSKHKNIDVSNYANERLRDISLSSNENYYICNNPDIPTTNNNLINGGTQDTYIKLFLFSFFFFFLFLCKILGRKLKKRFGKGVSHRNGKNKSDNKNKQ